MKIDVEKLTNLIVQEFEELRASKAFYVDSKACIAELDNVQIHITFTKDEDDFFDNPNQDYICIYPETFAASVATEKELSVSEVIEFYEKQLETLRADKLIEAIRDCEKRHFRTVDDTGASSNSQIILNTFRGHAGLPSVFDTDLPKYNKELKRYVMPEGSKLLSEIEKREAGKSVAQQVAVPGGWRVTKQGQIQVGDWLSFIVGGKQICSTAKEILNAGTDREEVIYNRKKNHYFLTSMVIDGTSQHKDVFIIPNRALSAAPKPDSKNHE